MIRFIDLKEQIFLDSCPYFTFYDTVGDHFVMFNGNQTWHKWEEFERDYATHGELFFGIERYKSLIPEDYFKEKP